MAKFCADVFTFMLVTILLCGAKCYSLSEDEFIAGTRHEVRSFNQDDQADISIKWRVFNSISHHELELERVGNISPGQNLLTKLKTTANSSKAIFNAPRRSRRLHPRRIVRQAYQGYQTNIYPTLPPPPNSYPSYKPHIPNFNQNQTGYTPPYNPQFQPGYPGHTPNYNGYNTTGNQSPYNPAPSAPRQPLPSNPYGPGYPNTFNNYNSSRPQNMPGYQPYPGSSFNNINPGYQPYQGFSNNNSVYNPSQRAPYYPSGNNSFNPHQPNYSPYTTTPRTQRIPNNLPNEFGTPNPPSGFPNFKPGSMPSNTSYVNYPTYPYRPGPNGQYYSSPPPVRPGYGPTQSYSTTFPSTYQTGHQNSSYSGFPNNNNTHYPTGQNVYSYYSRPNNNTTNFTGHNAGVGYYPQGYNNQNIPTYGPPKPANGTVQSVVYNPNFPRQSPPSYNYGGHDPTRVPPERFSY